MDEYLGRVDHLLDSVSAILSAEERGEILHLIDHGEPAEGLRALAWIIVRSDKYVPAESIAMIRTLSDGLIAEKDMPPTLDDHALPQD
jgi:hypothetical protein